MTENHKGNKKQHLTANKMAIGVIYFELNNNYGNHNFEFGFRINATGV